MQSQEEVNTEDTKYDAFWDYWGVKFLMRMPNTHYVFQKFRWGQWTLDFIPNVKDE